MKRIEAVIRPSRLDAVKQALSALGVGGMTVTAVHGCGQQSGRTEHGHGATYTIDLLAKTKLEVVVPDALGDPVVSTICKTARTGSPGDGVVFVFPLEAALRIRSGETGDAAL